MYLSSDAPQEPNGLMPLPQCRVDRDNRYLANLAWGIYLARRASAVPSNPASYQEFGDGVMAQVQRAQAGAPQTPAGSDEIAANTSLPPQLEYSDAPQVMPLGGAAGVGCGMTAAPKSESVNPPTLPIQRFNAQTVALVPQGRPPKYKNLCWALSSGAVIQAQFDIDTLVKLSRKCQEQNYPVACLTPPSDVTTWIAAQQRAGTLPHINVSQDEIDAIPPAEPIAACGEPLWKAGGLVGYNGPWGDSPFFAAMPKGPDENGTGSFWSNPWVWGLIGIAALAGLGAWDKKKRP